jgi:hypothetical protein
MPPSIALISVYVIEELFGFVLRILDSKLDSAQRNAFHDRKT